jgi:hypothetical protein
MVKNKKDRWIWDDFPEPFRSIMQYIIVYGLALCLIYAFLPTMLELGIITTIGFIISCALSLYRKVVLHNPIAPGLIAVGYILSSLAIKQILPKLYENIVKQSFLTAAIIGLVFLAIYLKSRELNKVGINVTSL